MKAPLLAMALLLSLPALAQTTKPAAPVPTDANFAALDALAKQDYDRAVRLWRPVAARGDKEAQYQLGLLASANGPQELRNPSEARLWLGKAAEQGHIEAQYQYGLALGWGDSARPNREGARQWLEKARDAGHPNAQAALGQLNTIPETAVAAAPAASPPPPTPRAVPAPEPVRQPSMVTSEPLAKPVPPPAPPPAAAPPAAAPVAPPPPVAAPQPVAPPPPPVTAELPPPPPPPAPNPAPTPIMPMTDAGPSIGELLSSGFNRPAAPSRDGGVQPPAKPEAAATPTAPAPAAPETAAAPATTPAAVPPASTPASPPPPPVAALVQMPAQPTPAQALEADYLNARRQPGWQPRIVTDGAAQPALPLMSPPPPVREAVTVDLAALPPSAPTPTSPVTLIRPGSTQIAPQAAPVALATPTAMVPSALAAPTPITPARSVPVPAAAPLATPAVAIAPAVAKPPPPVPAPAGDGWRIRFAVLSKESSIPGTLTAYREKADAFLGEESITVEPVSVSGPWRIYLNGRYDKGDAERRCSGIKKTGLDCLVTR